MARTPAQVRLNPTLFDKLVAGNEIGGLRGDELEEVEQRRDSLRYFSVTALERFNEAALRATVRRELAWLLNTTNFESGNDLAEFPHVRTSVVNFGISDLAGKSTNSRQVIQRAREIRQAIQTFEPRIDPATLEVEVSGTVERENALTFVIQADIRSAVRAVPIKLRTDIEVDSAAVTIRG